MATKRTQRMHWATSIHTMTARVTDKLTGQEARFEASELPDEIQKELLLMGITQVLSDRNSGVEADAKIDAYAETWEMFKTGRWKRERVGGIGGAVSAEVLVIVDLKGCSAEAASAAWQALPADQREAFRASQAEAIAAKKAAISEAKQEASVALDDLI